MGRPLDGGGLPEPQRLHACIAAQDALPVQSDGQRDRLKPCFERSDEPLPPGRVSNAGQAGEQEAEVDLLLSRRVVRGVPSRRVVRVVLSRRVVRAGGWLAPARSRACPARRWRAGLCCSAGLTRAGCAADR